jgi:hypothetical protein
MNEGGTQTGQSIRCARFLSRDDKKISIGDERVILRCKESVKIQKSIKNGQITRTCPFFNRRKRERC